MAFLLLLVVTQQTAIVVHFKLNQQAIEQKFCVNKNKPELQCQGTCYLRKELQKTENNSLKINELYKDFEMIPVAHFEFETKLKPIVTKLKVVTYEVSFPLDPYTEVLTPPPNYIFTSFSII